MRILIVTPWFPTSVLPHSGVFVVRDALALGARHDVRIIHLASPTHLGDDDAASQVRGVPVTRVPMSRANPLHWLRAARTVRAAARSADLVHTQAISGLLPFAVVRPGRGKPWIHTEHWSALTTPDTLPRWVRPGISIVARLLTRPDVVTAVCERLAAPIRRIRGDRPVEIIGCVIVPATSVAEPPRDPSLLRLVSVGALVPRKDPLTAVRTVAALAERDVNARLTWVGDGPLRDEVTALAARLGIADRLVLTGSLDDEGVRRALDAADLMLMPTLGDNFCTVVAESLSHGRPVVSGIETGADEYTDPAVGEFVADQDGEHYADAVVRVTERTAALSAADIADSLGTRFTPESVADAYTSVYDQVIARRRSARR